MVVQQFIKLCHSLQVSNLSLFLVTNGMASRNKDSIKLFMTYSCSGLIYMKGMEIKQNILNLQDLK